MTPPGARPLDVLSAGAAKGIVGALAGSFERATGAGIVATFDAVGAIRERLLEGSACDVLISTAPMLEALAASGEVDGSSTAVIGRVATGIAVPGGAPLPRVADSEELRACLLDASALYCPDTARATAGVHFARVLDALRIRDEVASKLRAYPNGARAMAAMAEEARDTPAGAVGCTQVTEILYTPGVTLVAPLPAPFALATLYSAAVASRARDPGRARALVAMLTGPSALALRIAGGFG